MKVTVLSERLGMLDFNGPFLLKDNILIDESSGGYSLLTPGKRYFFSDESYPSIPLNSFREEDYPDIITI